MLRTITHVGVTETENTRTGATKLSLHGLGTIITIDGDKVKAIAPQKTIEKSFGGDYDLANDFAWSLCNRLLKKTDQRFIPRTAN